MDKRERVLTDDGLSQRYERQILTFDHSTQARKSSNLDQHETSINR